jgi:oligopeptide/dipeptide ABC transporter ATP-binding protein
MYLGKVVEMAAKHDLLEKTAHPYTQALFSAIPIPNPDLKRSRIVLKGDVPSPSNPPPGCRFHPRCIRAGPRCAKEEPMLLDIGGERLVACHLYDGGVGS